MWCDLLQVCMSALHARLGVAEAGSWVAEGVREGVIWGWGLVCGFVSPGRPCCEGGRCKAWCGLLHVFMFVPECAGALRVAWPGRVVGRAAGMRCAAGCRRSRR